MPRRLLEVSNESMRLVDTQNIQQARYVTLSHCWGQDNKYLERLPRTTLSNIAQRQVSIDPQVLPPLFQDAVQVTRGISCSYIWIDSLCIVQDDAVDWKEQASAMSDIYPNAFINIAATACPDAWRSLFNIRYVDDRDFPGDTGNETYQLSRGISVRPLLNLDYRYLSGDTIRGYSHYAPLQTRGWVFQETLLSRRNAHFCYSQMIWECRTRTICECGGRSTLHDEAIGARGCTPRHKAAFHRLLREQCELSVPLKWWYRILAAFSSKQLSRLSDWPFALAGVASRLQEKVTGSHIAGIWAVDLPRALLWECCAMSPVPNLKLSEVAPTWSPNARAFGQGDHRLGYWTVLRDGLFAGCSGSSRPQALSLCQGR